MTQRPESMLRLKGARARWDKEARKVRYYTHFDGTEDWIEIPGADFSHLVHLYAQEALNAACNAITGTPLADFMAFRHEVEKLSRMTQPPTSEGAKN